MIIPNLLVTDIARSVAFYRDVLDMTLVMAVTPEREMLSDVEGADAAFAILEWKGSQLMLQTAAALAEDLAVFSPDQKPSASGTVYLRDIHPKDVIDRVPPDRIVKGPALQWYGMVELYFQDPDGYVICVGMPEGPPPAEYEPSQDLSRT